MAFSRREWNLFQQHYLQRVFPYSSLEKSGGAVCPGTAPRIKVPPFSETDRGHSYSGRETDSTLLVCQALYNCSGPPTLAQKAA